MTLELAYSQPTVAYSFEDLTFTIADAEQRHCLEERLHEYWKRGLGGAGIAGANRQEYIALKTFEAIIKVGSAKRQDNTPMPVRLHPVIWKVQDDVRSADLLPVIKVPPIYVRKVRAPRPDVATIQNIAGFDAATFARAYSEAQDYCRPAPHLHLA